MLHPVLESLFLLKVARGYVSESIIGSDIEEKQELVNYIQNEASDYEVMHLVTLGEMPEVKFDEISEQAVWTVFKDMILMNTDALREDILEGEIKTIVYEMGPVSDFGYSSAAPILEFHKANGALSALSEFRNTSEKSGNKYNTIKDGWREKNKGQKRADRAASRTSGSAGKYAPQDDWHKQHSDATTAAGAKELRAAEKHEKKKNTMTFDDRKEQMKTMVRDNPGVSGAAAGALGVAGIYGIYKLIKKWRAKVKAAKGSAEVQTAKAGLKAAQTKLKAAKKKA